jgi:hypothetical protein
MASVANLAELVEWHGDLATKTVLHVAQSQGVESYGFPSVPALEMIEDETLPHHRLIQPVLGRWPERSTTALART